MKVKKSTYMLHSLRWWKSLTNQLKLEPENKKNKNCILQNFTILLLQRAPLRT